MKPGAGFERSFRKLGQSLRAFHVPFTPITRLSVAVTEEQVNGAHF